VDEGTDDGGSTTSAPLPSSPDSPNRRGKRKGKGDDQVAEESYGDIGTSFNGSESAESSKKRRKALLMADLIDEDDSLYSAKIQIPFELKRHAVDEWNLIAKESATQRLLLLPKKSQSNVRAIFRAFLDMKKSDKSIEESILFEYYQFMSIFLLQFDRVSFVS
jgi:adenylosuccinate synthase